MQVINVDLKEKSYDIMLGTDYLSAIPELIIKNHHYKKVFIVTDETVKDLYLDDLVNTFNVLDVVCKSYAVPAGEISKSMENLSKLYEVLSENNFTRKDCVIALGGGVVGDLTGFAAATYLRGIDFIQIPTTLLSQVDSSVGGKVAINIPQGKNLVGNFYQPKAVYIDVAVLKTLDEREIKSGLAEVIKYACIYDQSFFNFLMSNNIKTIQKHYIDIISKCLEIKKIFVQKDEKEDNIRMHLNFGHTIGHAIERYGQYKILNHGEAVAMGMLLIVEASYKEGLVNESLFMTLREMLEAYGLINSSHYELNELMSYIKNDKKTSFEDINIILLETIGKSYIKNVPFTWLETFLSEVI